MKLIVLYTLARFVLFLLAWGVVWLLASLWLEWNDVTALWTALIAVVVSAVAAYLLLKPLRQRMASAVDARARGVRRRFEDSRRREDVDE